MKKAITFILILSICFGYIVPLSINATDYEYYLQYNTILNSEGEWVTIGGDDISMPQYNCYAYAIGRFEVDPFYCVSNEKLQYQPGDIVRIREEGYDYSVVDDLVEYIIEDLIVLGYNSSSIVVSSSIPNNLSASQELICVRIGEKAPNQIDYHFMRYDINTDSWYHKPGKASILKYNSIPNNSENWIDETQGGLTGAVYSGPIKYITYNKKQIIVDVNCEWEGSIGINSGDTMLTGKDVFYEIIVPQSCNYNIQITTPYHNSTFNYEIYSYNMYNGAYEVLVSGSGNSNNGVNESVELKAYSDFNDNTPNWIYNSKKYYVRLDFNKENRTSQYINFSISINHEYTYNYNSISTKYHEAYCECGEYLVEPHRIENGCCVLCGEVHTHEYTDHYESISRNKHKSYCSCGEYITESHQVEGDACVLCGAAHLHTYMYSWVSNTGHRVNCTCGYSEVKSHVVPADAFGSGEMFATCLLCNGRVTLSESIMSIVNLPRSENGSFILPNGVIVLTDEDIESYMNGTLEFIYPEDDSVAL